MIFFLEDANCVIIECQCRSASEVNLVEHICVCGGGGGGALAPFSKVDCWVDNNTLHNPDGNNIYQPLRVMK